MLSLPRSVLALILWLTFFFNIERLHVNKSELINIAFPTYLLVAALVVLGLLLPQWFHISLTPMFTLAFLAFGVVKFLHGRPFWGDAYTYVTLFELTSVLLTVTLAHRVGRLTADLGETIQALLFAGLNGRVHPAEQAEVVAKREMLSARRRNHPLSLLLIEADTQNANIALSTTAQEIQRLIAQRIGLVTLTRLLASSLRGSDSIVDESERGRWFLLTSIAERTSANAILQRLNEQATKALGIQLKFGIANYPDQGLTFKDLVASAEQDLHAEKIERRGDTIPDSTPLLNEEPGVKAISPSTSAE